MKVRHFSAVIALAASVVAVAGNPRTGDGAVTLVGWCVLVLAIATSVATTWLGQNEDQQRRQDESITYESTQRAQRAAELAEREIHKALTDLSDLFKMVVFASSVSRPAPDAPRYGYEPWLDMEVAKNLDPQSPEAVRALKTFSLTPQFSLRALGPFPVRWGDEEASVDQVASREARSIMDRLRVLVAIHADVLTSDILTPITELLGSSILKRTSHLSDEIARWVYIEDTRFYPITFVHDHAEAEYLSTLENLRALLETTRTVDRAGAVELPSEDLRARAKWGRYITTVAALSVASLGVLFEPRNDSSGITITGWTLILLAVAIAAATLWQLHWEGMALTASREQARAAIVQDEYRAAVAMSHIHEELSGVYSVMKMVVFASSLDRRAITREVRPGSVPWVANPKINALGLTAPEVVNALEQFSLVPSFSLGRTGPFTGPFGTDLRTVDQVVGYETSQAVARLGEVLAVHARFLAKEVLIPLTSLIDSETLSRMRRLAGTPGVMVDDARFLPQGTSKDYVSDMQTLIDLLSQTKA